MFRHFTALVIVIVPAVAAWSETTGDHIRGMGIEARINPETRDATLRELAEMLTQLAEDNRQRAHDLQQDFQYAVLLATDPGVYDTLAMDTILAVDNAMESTYTFEDVIEGDRWDPLTYAHGFYNRDVTAREIKDVAERWRDMEDDERRRQYPTYIHVIDAVTKPLAMGALTGGEDETHGALGIAVPLLKEMLLQEVLPGRAFHPPSHAALVLGPLHERWADHPRHGDLVRGHLGDREAFITLMEGRLIAAQPNPSEIEGFQRRFYAIVGQYVANALARMNARSAVPTLRECVSYYARGVSDTAVAYTKRALVALGDTEARSAIEDYVERGQRLGEVEAIAVWLIRNGRGETVAYGQELLGRILDTDPESALRTHFENELARLDD